MSENSSGKNQAFKVTCTYKACNFIANERKRSGKFFITI
jgi:hypothetical protein